MILPHQIRLRTENREIKDGSGEVEKSVNIIALS